MSLYTPPNGAIPYELMGTNDIHTNTSALTRTQLLPVHPAIPVLLLRATLTISPHSACYIASTPTSQRG